MRTQGDRNRAANTGNRLIIAGNHSDSGPEGEYWRTRIVPEIGHGGVEYVGAVDDAQKDKAPGQRPGRWSCRSAGTSRSASSSPRSLACGTPVISCPTGALPEIDAAGRGRFSDPVDRGGLRSGRQSSARSTAPPAASAPSEQLLGRRRAGALPRALHAPDRGESRMSRRLVLVSSHFAPSNLVGGHRARLWSRYLPGVRLGADRRDRRSAALRGAARSRSRAAGPRRGSKSCMPRRYRRGRSGWSAMSACGLSGAAIAPSPIWCASGGPISCW